MATILVVDDEIDILALVRTFMSKVGHRVLTAISGEEALEVTESEIPDVAILDVAMPGMDGLQLLQKLRQKEGMNDLPAIFLSAKVQPEDIAAGRALGAGYLTKPFHAHTLEEAVKASLGGSSGNGTAPELG
ncbi:MAG: response regulator transcription factor [Actinomycetota bacterium]